MTSKTWDNTFFLMAEKFRTNLKEKRIRFINILISIVIAQKPFCLMFIMFLDVSKAKGEKD